MVSNLDVSAVVRHHLCPAIGTVRRQSSLFVPPCASGQCLLQLPQQLRPSSGLRPSSSLTFGGELLLQRARCSASAFISANRFRMPPEPLFALLHLLADELALHRPHSNRSGRSISRSRSPSRSGDRPGGLDAIQLRQEPPQAGVGQLVRGNRGGRLGDQAGSASSISSSCRSAATAGPAFGPAAVSVGIVARGRAAAWTSGPRRRSLVSCCLPPLLAVTRDSRAHTVSCRSPSRWASRVTISSRFTWRWLVLAAARPCIRGFVDDPPRASRRSVRVRLQQPVQFEIERVLRVEPVPS